MGEPPIHVKSVVAVSVGSAIEPSDEAKIQPEDSVQKSCVAVAMTVSAHSWTVTEGTKV